MLLYTDWRRKDTSGQNEEAPYRPGGRGDHRPTSTVPDPKQQNRHSYSKKHKGKSRQQNDPAVFISNRENMKLWMRIFSRLSYSSHLSEYNGKILESAKGASHDFTWI